MAHRKPQGKRFRVVLTGKATKNRVPVFEFCFGELRTRRAADCLAAKVRVAHPKGVVKIEEIKWRLG